MIKNWPCNEIACNEIASWSKAYGICTIFYSGRIHENAAYLPVVIQVATGRPGVTSRPAGLARSGKGTRWRGPPRSRRDLAADRNPPVIAAYRVAAISGTLWIMEIGNREHAPITDGGRRSSEGRRCSRGCWSRAVQSQEGNRRASDRTASDSSARVEKTLSMSINRD
ncbi:hypothetical protein Taro_033063 [Colocasia esculenta]|uniref:Uncharacterized protein n=1 Tax=Colocasia esculenta TaxID=4460 RepID=A0A843VWR6_COLES|nr:hypothetical protein [Colocasia esculenta]